MHYAGTGSSVVFSQLPKISSRKGKVFYTLRDQRDRIAHL